MKLLMSLLMMAALFSACSSKKQEDPALDGVWVSKKEKTNEKTGDENIELVTYEFRGNAVTINYLNGKNLSLNQKAKLQTEFGTYKKVGSILEVSIQKSTCAFYSSSSNTTSYEQKDVQKISYELSKNLSQLTIRTLTRNIVLKRLTEIEEDAMEVSIAQSESGCFDPESQEFKKNDITPIRFEEVRSSNPL